MISVLPDQLVFYFNNSIIMVIFYITTEYFVCTITQPIPRCVKYACIQPRLGT